MALNQFTDLVGQSLASVTGEDKGDEIIFNLTDGRQCKLYHQQDCCEDVHIESIDGDLTDLVGTVLTAYEESGEGHPSSDDAYDTRSSTWTFYRISTILGTVTIRWRGASNGYYSESVDFTEIR